MLSIMNIQFGNNKNNTDKVKKIYNQGNIITARPKTAKYPYKILSIREFPKLQCDDIFKEKTKVIINNNNNKYKIQKSFSFVEDSKTSKKQKLKNKNYFNQSSHENNILFTSNQKIEKYGVDAKIRKIFSATQRKTNLFQNNNNDIFNKEIDIKKNTKLLKKGIEGINDNNKKKVSSYSMSKYIEKYIDKGLLKSNKNLTTNNNYNTNYDIFNDDNTQVIQFLSEVINTDHYNNNYNFNTTNNIIKKYNKNKNKNTTRNLIIKRYYKTNHNKISLSYTKNSIKELKPLIINCKDQSNFFKLKKENNRKNMLSKYNNKFEKEIKLKKNKSSKISTTKNQTENNILIKRPLSIETNKKYEGIKTMKKEEKKNNNNINKNITCNDDKDKIKKTIKNFRISNKYRKKLRFSKDIKIKNKQKKSIKNNDINNINNEFLNYVNNIKNDKLHYNNKTKYYRGFRSGKNSDIYDYIINPKESEGIITNEVTNNDYIEYKSINQ